MVICLTAGLGPMRPAANAGHRKFTVPLPIPPVLTGRNITLTMKEADVPILPGEKTRMWTFNGTFPGPTIRRPSGTRTRVTVVNDLPDEAGSMTIHHHGNHSAPRHDGQPDDHLIPPGGSRTYTYRLMEGGGPERAAFQWYHDHRMDVTGRNVWMGLAGMSIIDDAFDRSLPLPRGRFDVPLMVTDREFDSDNQIPYAFDSEGPVTDHLLTNGAAEPYFDVADRKYRFRLLNASNVGIWTFTLSNEQEMVQIATDSGLLPEPVPRTEILLGPAERAEVVIDFAGHLGEKIILGTTTAGDVVEFRVTRDGEETSTIPSTLRPVPAFGPPDETRVWELGEIPDLQRGVVWTINGNTFDPDRVDAYPELGSTEKWVFVNKSSSPHVMHIHDVDWLLQSRNGRPPAPHEAGLKESFFISAPGVLEMTSRFTDHVGRYVFHCHLLEHEDQSMMAQFEVVDS